MSPPKKSIAIKAKNDISVYASPDRHVINEAAASAAAVVVDGEQVAGGESVGNNEPRPAAASRIIKLKRGQNPPSRDGKRDDDEEDVGTTEATSSMDAEESFVTGATDSSVGVELLKTDENNNNQAGSSSSSSTAMEEGDNVVNKVVSNEGEGGGESCNLIDEKENGSTIEDEEQEVDHPTDDLLNSKDENDDNTVDDEDKASMKEKKKAASHGAHPPAMNLYPGYHHTHAAATYHAYYHQHRAAQQQHGGNANPHHAAWYAAQQQHAAAYHHHHQQQQRPASRDDDGDKETSSSTSATQAAHSQAKGCGPPPPKYNGHAPPQYGHWAAAAHHQHWTSAAAQQQHMHGYKHYQAQAAAAAQAAYAAHVASFNNNMNKKKKNNKVKSEEERGGGGDQGTPSGDDVSKRGTPSKNNKVPSNITSNDEIKSSENEKKKNDTNNKDDDDATNNKSEENKAEETDAEKKKKPVSESTSWNSSSQHGQYPPSCYHYGWHAHHAAAARAGYHAYHQQHGKSNGQPPVLPHPAYNPYWQQYHRSHAAYVAQQQQAAVIKQGKKATATASVSATASNNQGDIKQQQQQGECKSGANNTKRVIKSTNSTANSTSNNNNKTKKKKEYLNIKTVNSTTSVSSKGSKKRSRDDLELSEHNMVLMEVEDDDARDDFNTKTNSYLSDGEDYIVADDDGSSSLDGGLSLGGFSLGSLGHLTTNKEASSPKGKRRKGPPSEVFSSSPTASGHYRSQSIHRTLSNTLNDVDYDKMKLLEASSTFSEGKMILKNLSINSSYSAEFADLCGPSPLNSASSTTVVNAAHHHSSSGHDNMKEEEEEVVDIDVGLTPKKNNKSSKKKKKKKKTTTSEAPVVSCPPGGAEGGMSGLMTINTSHEQDSSPTMFDLIGGAETPTTGMLMNSYMESALNDEIRSLNGHLRGQSFTPLPMMMSDNVVDVPTSGSIGGGVSCSGMQLGTSGDLSITPQLSWGTGDGSSPLDITPRCFGLLDSTKSSRSGMNNHPLGSPKSFWKDNILDKSTTSMDSVGNNNKQVKSILSILSPTMREMEIVQDGSFNSLEGEVQNDTSPLPLYYEQRSAVTDQENENNHQDGKSTRVKPPVSHDPRTPLRRPPMVPSDVHSASAPPADGDLHQQHRHAHHGAASPWGFDYPMPHGSSTFSPSPVPHGAASPYGHHHPYGYHMFHPQQPGASTYDPNERVRNLRGNGPPRHQMPPQHHLPPPSYHNYSPLINVNSHRGGGYGNGAMNHGHDVLPNRLDLISGGTSKRRCIPIKPPIPSKFQGDMEEYKDASVPDFNNLVNFPGHMTNKPCTNVPDGMRCCVMCGQACPSTTGGRNKKGNDHHHGNIPRMVMETTTTQNPDNKKAGTAGGSSSISGTVAPLGDSTGNNTNKSTGNTSTVPSSTSSMTSISQYANIPTQNKGLCTICDVNVWIVAASGLEIKWCKGCKNFRPWAAFGDKGLATKCVRCRERQREKYAMQKEEKEQRAALKKKNSSASSKLRREQRNKIYENNNMLVGVGGQMGRL